MKTISCSTCGFTPFLISFFCPFFKFMVENFIDKIRLRMLLLFLKEFIFFSLKKFNNYQSNQISTHTNASRRVSDSSRSKIRRASWILFEISSICLRLKVKHCRIIIYFVFYSHASPVITSIYKAYFLFQQSFICDMLHLHKTDLSSVSQKNPSYSMKYQSHILPYYLLITMCCKINTIFYWKIMSSTRISSTKSKFKK
jgi:hypothetical protein